MLRIKETLSHAESCHRQDAAVQFVITDADAASRAGGHLRGFGPQEKRWSSLSRAEIAAAKDCGTFVSLNV